jgi:hypothetical protein
MSRNYWLANSHDGLYAATGVVVAKSLAGTAESTSARKWTSTVSINGMPPCNSEPGMGFVQ